MRFFKRINKKLEKITKTKKILIASIVLTVAAFLSLRGGANLEEIKTTPVERKSISSEVLSTGKIRSDQEVLLNFALSGKVVWVPVAKGDFVKKGQVIATLDREKFEIALRQAQQDVIAADAELERLYDDLAKRTAAENYDDRVRRTKIEAAKNIAFDNMKLAERNLKDAVLTSPITGPIIELNTHTGDEVFPTETAARIATTQEVFFVAQIDESDIGTIRNGQKAIIILDAFPEKEIAATVDSIAPDSTITSTGATVFEVDFSLPPEDNFRLGLNGEAKITIESAENALVIPLETLVDDQYVWVKKDNQYQKREIEKGLATETEVQIISGLKEGETIVTSGFEQIGKKSLFQKMISKVT